MTAILRHPSICLLMGVMPKIPNIVIVFEHVAMGSLFNVLHMKKSQITIDLKQRLKIALDAARVFQYMHTLGIVHRDIKSHNILLDQNLEVKVCDFGLARFKVKSPPLTAFRLTWAKDRCNTRVPPCTWLLSCFKKDNTMKVWTFLHLAPYSGKSFNAKFHMTAWRQLISVPKLKKESRSNFPIIWTPVSAS